MTSLSAKPINNINHTGVSESGESLCVSEGNLFATVLRLPCQNESCPTVLKISVSTTNIISPILLSLAGVIGLVWALYYLYSGDRRPKGSRTVFYLLLRKLMWTDLFGKIITAPVAVITYANREWIGGVPMCNYHAFSMMLIGMVTHSLVSAMAVERLLGIRHGIWYSKNITPYRTRLLLMIIWVFSILFCALPLFGFGQYARQYPGTWCFVNTHLCSESPLKHRLYTNMYGAINILNLLIIVTCNVVVITTLLRIRLCRSQRSILRFCQARGGRKQRELEIQMVVLLMVITCVFMISFMPLDLSIFVNQIVPHLDHRQELLFIRLASINQIMDPWSYIIMRKVFMTSAWKCVRLVLLGRRLSRKVSPPPFWTQNNKTHKANLQLQEDDLCDESPFEAVQYKEMLQSNPVQYGNELPAVCLQYSEVHPTIRSLSRQSLLQGEMYSMSSADSEEIPHTSLPYVYCTGDDTEVKNNFVWSPEKYSQELNRRHSWACAMETVNPKQTIRHKLQSIKFEKLEKCLIKPFYLNTMNNNNECETQFLKDNEWYHSKENFERNTLLKTYL
ncbi:unnamed protein product [Meganyctiphanes norvegica]|uniref:G-protein coupled receptors family 1 profile domain-containing protein n=1 Tax=Meganyctiphanes norvegica TaxID=48144 RepID=A0AAV2S6V3_MEGNR